MIGSGDTEIVELFKYFFSSNAQRDGQLTQMYLCDLAHANVDDRVITEPNCTLTHDHIVISRAWISSRIATLSQLSL